MHLIAIDIGNTNIKIGLFLEGKEESIDSFAGGDWDGIGDCIKKAWDKVPVLASSKEQKRDGVVAVCSVKPEWTVEVAKVVRENIDEKIKIVGEDLPYPIELSIDQSDKVGSDRVLAAAAAFAVIESAVVVADFGTALTIDMVDDRGVFVGGVICPGFEVSSKALRDYTALLPEVEVKKPDLPWGKNTEESINCGLYYASIGTLEEVVRRYAEKVGAWPQVIITGAGAAIIKDDCPFVDSYVPDVVLRGIALACQKSIENK